MNTNQEHDAGGGSLSTRQVDAFAREGFLLVRGFFDGAQVRGLSDGIDELAARPEAPGTHWVYYEEDRVNPGRRVLSRIENFCPFHPRLDALINGPRMMRALEALLGERAVLFKDKINFKMPGSAGFEPHQDVQAGWDRYGPLHLTALVSVDATTRENGCLELAPGWHDRGPIGEHWKPLGELVPDHAYVACPTQPGDVVFFDSFIPHRSAANATARPRRVLYVTYNGVSAGDQRSRYYADKHASFPPDIDREEGREYVYRV